MPKYVLYTAVLPAYREHCMALVGQVLGIQYMAYTGSAHLDPTVRTGISKNLYTPIRNHRFASGRVLLQTGKWMSALRSSTTILDLNPRSLTAWYLLIARRILGKRTLLWGHLHPQNGGRTRTASLRRSMRRISSGTILYGYDSVETARAELLGGPVWVAPNSLYPRSELGFDKNFARNRILYVGRLENAKKLDLLVAAFAHSELYSKGYQLTIVGHGSQADHLQDIARELSVDTYCQFIGRTYDAKIVRELYNEAICSVSPGYAGLSLTQSIGFGVPVLVADNELHSPEIELDRTGAVHYFTSDSVQSLASSLCEIAAVDWTSSATGWSNTVARYYCAESMAAGLIAAFRNEEQSLGKDGWPKA